LRNHDAPLFVTGGGNTPEPDHMLATAASPGSIPAAGQPSISTPPTAARSAGGGRREAALKSVAVFVVCVWEERGRKTVNWRVTDGTNP